MNVIKLILILCLAAVVYFSYDKKARKLLIVIYALELFSFIKVVIYPGAVIEDYHMTFGKPFVFIGLLIAIYKIVVTSYKKIRNKYYEFDANNDFVTLNREIDVYYNPSVVGYLVNQRLEFKDLAADIMNLYARKMVDIKKNNVGKYEINIVDNNYMNAEIDKSDKYILESINNQYSKFDFTKWCEYVKEVYGWQKFTKKQEGFVKKMVRNIFLIELCGTIIFSIWLKYFSNSKDMIGLSAFILSTMITIVYVLVRDIMERSKSTKDMYLNTKGKEELKKWMKFKKFITEYTLIEERKAEEIVIYEKYIPYAVAMRNK